MSLPQLLGAGPLQREAFCNMQTSPRAGTPKGACNPITNVTNVEGSALPCRLQYTGSSRGTPCFAVDGENVSLCAFWQRLVKHTLIGRNNCLT